MCEVCGEDLKILVVDDTAFNILTLSSMIEQTFGIVPDEAHNGEVAVEKYKKNASIVCHCPYKLVLMDI